MYKNKRYSRNLRKKTYGPRRYTARSGGRPNKFFDPRDVINNAQKNKPAAVKVHEIKHNFCDFNLNAKLYSNIVAHGFTKPTPIQDQAIPYVMADRDVVGIANTGTGKTAAFLIPLINKVCQNRTSRVLILTPTRELASQISKEFKILSAGLDMHSTTCIGGTSMRQQISNLQRDPHFVVGTPGRLLDLIRRGNLNLSRFNSIVLDEVDRMLDMGFIHDINKIIAEFPEEKQSLFFAATMNPKVKGVMEKIVKYPITISVKTQETRDNIKQNIVTLNGRSKTTVLREILRQEEVNKAIVFMRTKRHANDLHVDLSKNGFRTAVMHGNKSQNQRQKALERFRKGHARVLVATDVAARGLDIDDITHVINYDLPESYEVYVHRIGRTGRANKKGVAITLVA